VRRYDPVQLIALGADVFAALGAPDDIAHEVASSLVAANLTGHDSHGVQRIPRYAQAIRRGALKPAARPTLLLDQGVIASVGGKGGFGQLAARVATELAVARAREHHLAAVAAVDCYHMGRMGEWAEIAAAQGMLGLNLLGVNFGPCAAPFGGRRRALGTNPLAFATPGPDDAAPALLGDFATTVVAEGKLNVARAQGLPVPAGTILDAAGTPSTNPHDFYAGGALLPAGGYKGTALALLAEVLGCALTGAEQYLSADGYNGALFICIAPDAFRPRASFDAASASVLAKARSCPPAEGCEAVLVPGDPEQRARAERAQHGIPLPDATWNELVALATALGVAVP
jgi:LDH2 family malate/lactate/ureidoglycolate dehydrogenase